MELAAFSIRLFSYSEWGMPVPVTDAILSKGCK
jgi:hypothetical protein